MRGDEGRREGREEKEIFRIAGEGGERGGLIVFLNVDVVLVDMRGGGYAVW